MGGRVLITRPEPGAVQTAKRLRALGWKPVCLPLTEISPLPAELPAGCKFDAVAIPSANAIRHARPALLRALAGLPVFAVGQRTAEAFVAYVDDPARFGNIRQAGAYFGLVPCQDASAHMNRLGHITKDGPSAVRQLLVEASWQGILRSGRIKAHYQQIVDKKPERRKIALVATARWLSTVMLSMLKSGQCWREEEQTIIKPA